MPTNNNTPYGYCQCGCGQKTDICERSRYTVGWIKGKPKPFLPHHRPAKTTYIVDQRTDCWVWQGYIRDDGYSYGSRHGKYWLMHCYFYEQQHGSVPPGKELDHICRNRACVNPAHLEPVTRAINIQRGDKAKLTPEKVKEIRALKGKQEAVVVARAFGVCLTTIQQIWRKHTWKNL